MKVILIEENRVADVADGFARNFLFPRKLAILATTVNLSKFEKKMQGKTEEIAAQKKAAQEISDKIMAAEVMIKVDASEEGKLFGSVTNQDVINAVKDQFGVELDRRNVNLNEHIKMIGEYVASVKLHHEVTAHLKIKVEKK
ncbi:50S ribosomal protein L9 [Candidatus Saganbacteria bacterium]|nr:50S ribosomal protein L9 [Candidatus Saganbacteria bacterium]